MEELTVFAEIEYSQKLGVPTAFEPGIWRYCLYATGEISLPCLKDTFNRTQVKVKNIIIDQREYTLFDDPATRMARLRTLSENEGGWVNDDSVVYIRSPGYKPPYVFYSHKYGVLMGFTGGSPRLLNTIMYRPGLLSAPKAGKSADALTYDKMKFNSTTISIENTNGQFDKVGSFFGNEFNLLVGMAPYSSLRHIAQYYIANIVVALDKATFHLKDKRERLSAKIPNKQFTEAEYPAEYQFFDDAVKDKDMQEVYGHCLGVPGVCLQGKQIYASGSSETKLVQYKFRFASRITRVDRIQVKMTSGEIDDPDGATGATGATSTTKKIDGWTTVYQRVKPNDGSPDDWSGNYPRWKPGIITGRGPEYWSVSTFMGITSTQLNPTNTSLLDNGEITLHWKVAKQGGEYENGINEVRMDGLFIDKTTPLAIIVDIMENYAGVPPDGLRYNTYEIGWELAPLTHKIGVMFDKPITVYEAIEKLQGGCVIGFQFYVHENRFTARLDNPNRAERPAIKSYEILNLDEVEIDWNAELYGTYTDIEYAYNYSEQAGRHFIDRSKQEGILDLHRIDKEWPVHSLLANEQDAEKKSGLLLEDFEELRPLIKNIKLHGPKWFDLRVYDIFPIDVYIPGEERDKYPHKLIMLIEQVGIERVVTAQKEEIDEYVTLINEEKERPGERKFAGSVRCQVLRVELDTKTGITTIDVRVREASKIWPK